MCRLAAHTYEPLHCVSFFFFTDTATTEIYTLSLHDALPISHAGAVLVHQHGVLVDREHVEVDVGAGEQDVVVVIGREVIDRKSTRLNSSHVRISYAVFCLKKKKKINKNCSTIETTTVLR